MFEPALEPDYYNKGMDNRPYTGIISCIYKDKRDGCVYKIYESFPRAKKYSMRCFSSPGPLSHKLNKVYVESYYIIKKHYEKIT